MTEDTMVHCARCSVWFLRGFKEAVQWGGRMCVGMRVVPLHPSLYRDWMVLNSDSLVEWLMRRHEKQARQMGYQMVSLGTGEVVS